MGLDMYLKMRVTKRISKDGQMLLELYDDPQWDEYGCSNMVEIIKTVAYWRKNNAIHNFFVQNVQDGKDECQESPVSKDVLLELRSRCVKILNSLDGMIIRVPKSLVQDFKADNEYWKKNQSVHKPFIQRIKLSFPGENLEEFEKTADKLNGYHRLSAPQSKVAEELLPTLGGFFFGSISYDGWYIQGLVKTIKMIDRALEIAKNHDCEFYYQASW